MYVLVKLNGVFVKYGLMRYSLPLFFLFVAITVNAQTPLTIEGQSYTNSDDTWYGVNIARTQPTALIFRNNAITSINRFGYLLSAGDEVPGAYNNNLDGAVITGNVITWNGTPTIDIIPHGIFTGHNINVNIKYNYLNRVPMAIIRKSNGMTDISGVVAYNIVKDPGIGVVVKGMNGVRIYNNTFYTSLTTSQSNRSLIDIYENPSVTPAGSATGTKISNNIFYTKNSIKNISITSACLSGFESDYNIFYCESGTPLFFYCGSIKTFEQWQALGYDTHSKVINPNFKDFVYFAPAVRLDYGKDLGSTMAEGLSVNARWGVTNPETAMQNGKWQVGAVIYKEVISEPPPIPLYSSSAINDATPSRLEITYNLALANIVPATSAFTVRVNSTTRSVSSVAISGSKVTLTLASPVAYGEAVTVAYTKPSANQLQTTAGGQAATLAAKTVNNNVAPSIPGYVSSLIENAAPLRLELTYNLALTNIVPATSSFTVRVGVTTRGVSSVAISGVNVILTLASPVAYGEAVTVSYTKPSTNPLQTPAGGQAATLAAQTVTNNVAPAIPAYVSSIIENATPSRLEMNYNLALANIAPATSSFTVRVGATTRGVSSVAISGTKIILTLTSPVAYGEAVTVAYTKPSANPLQTPAGGQAATLAAQTVTNMRGAPVNQPPTVSIASPAKSTAFVAPATVTIDATASDPDGTIVKVEFYNGTLKLGESIAAPWSFTWKEVQEGTYVITAAATDNSNSRTVSSAVSVVVEKAASAINLAPAITISSPLTNVSIQAPASITLTATASDPDGSITKVEYFLGGVKIGESLDPPFSFTFKCDTTGTFEITAIAYDNLNATTTSTPVIISFSAKREYPDLVNLYPSPNDGIFTIDFTPLTEINEEIQLFIINMTGKTVYSGLMTAEETSLRINMGDAVPGIYILKITDHSRILTTKRFIKY